MLTVTSVRFRYPEATPLPHKWVLDGLSLTIKPGECYLLLGGPGSGKTTLARFLLGAIPRHSGGEGSGEVALDGIALSSVPTCDLLGVVGLVSQTPEEQFFLDTVENEIIFPLESLGLPRKEMARRLTESLHFAEIDHLRGRRPSTLSGGEQRRVLFAVLFAVDPVVSILDETFDQVDYAFREKILSYFRKRGKMALLLASKTDGFHQRWPGPVSLLRRGKIVAGQEPAFEAALREEGVIPPERFPTLSPPLEGQLMEAKGVVYAYEEGGAFTLSVERFYVRPCEVVSLVGTNGSGKSTLGKLLAGMICPLRGSVTLAGQRSDTATLRRSVAYLFQNPDLQIFLPTIKEELIYGLHGVKDEEVETVISLFSLPPGGASPILLGYGEKRKVQVASYFLRGRRLYILDELDAGITFVDLVRIVDLLLVNRRSSVVLITHEPLLAKRLSHRLYRIEKGHLVEEMIR